MGLGEIRLGEMGLGEMGLGEMGQNLFIIAGRHLCLPVNNFCRPVIKILCYWAT